MRNFSLEERMFIEKSLKAGLSVRQIATELNRHIKSVYNEVKNRRTKDGYFGEVAHADYKEGTKLRYAHLTRNFSEDERKYIADRYNSSITICNIAAELGCSARKLSAYLKQSKLQKDSSPQEIGTIDRINALEEQIKILFELIKEKNIK